MKKKIILTILSCLSLLFVQTPQVKAIAPPSLPVFFFGNATIFGHPAPVGAQISAEINGTQVASTQLAIAGKYFIEIPNGSANIGKTVSFKINGIAKSNNQRQCANVATTPLINFNLIIEADPTPAPNPPSGGGGGGGAILTPSPSPNPSSQPLTSAQQKVDANKDDKIDALDFNALMVHWGEEGEKISADFNADNKVDILDFNMLMINWAF